MEQVDLYSVALDHAWQWFSLHADQRIKTLHLYVLFLALFTAGYGTFSQIHNRPLSIAVALIGVIVTASFWILEERNRRLVKIGEAALSEIEDLLSVECSLPSMRLLSAANSATGGLEGIVRYSWAIRAVLGGGLILMVVGLVLALR